MKCLPAMVAAALLTTSLHAQPTGSFERTLSVSGPVDLDASTDAGGIIVTTGNQGSVRIHATLKGQTWRWDSADIERRIRELERNPPIVQSGNSIRVGHVSDRNLLKGVSMKLEIITPPDSRLRAQADSGGIRVEGIHGPVDCKTDSGGIEAFRIGSDVRAAADSGGIHLREIKGQVVAHADSGGVEAIGIAGPVDVQTDSGGIHVAQTTPASIRARADSGGAHIKLASAGYDISAKSESGRINVPEMVVRGSLNRHHAEGKVRGGGPLVDVQVDSGNVDIED